MGLLRSVVDMVELAERFLDNPITPSDVQDVLNPDAAYQSAKSRFFEERSGFTEYKSFLDRKENRDRLMNNPSLPVRVTAGALNGRGYRDTKDASVEERAHFLKMYEEAIDAQRSGEQDLSRPAPAQRKDQFVSQAPSPNRFSETVVGRGDVIDTLLDTLAGDVAASDDQPPVVLRGIAGIGKTTVARRIGQLSFLRYVFPDGVFWTTVGPPHTRSAPDFRDHVRNQLQRWARGLDISVEDHPGLPALRNRLREDMHGQKVLLIIDDVWRLEDADHFTLGGPESAALITTRSTEIAQDLSRSSSPDAAGRHVRLGKLSPEASLSLFAAIAPEAIDRDSDLVRRLCERLEYHPLGVALAARRVRSTVSDLSTEELDTLIVKGSERLNLVKARSEAPRNFSGPPTVRALVELSVKDLPRPVQDRFAMTSVFGEQPYTWTLQKAAHVWGCSRREAGETLSKLCQEGLVEEAGDGTFQLHAILFDYARDLREERGL